jgi:hypothetical protein
MNAVQTALATWCDEDIRALRYQPSDNGWTSLQILEHTMLTSHYLMMIIDKASTKARKRASSSVVTHDWQGYDLLPKGLEEVGVHKSFPWTRPTHMEPTNKISVDELKFRLNEQFEKCRQHLNSLKNGEGRFCTTTMSVNSIGKLDVYQYIYFLILHAKRHLTQLENNNKEFESQRKWN